MKTIILGLLIVLFLFSGCTDQNRFLLVGDINAIGSNLNDLNDVVISNPSNQEALIYESITQSWKNQAQSGSGGSGIDTNTITAGFTNSAGGWIIDLNGNKANFQDINGNRFYVSGIDINTVLDSRYVNVTGDTMIGNLLIQFATNPTIDLIDTTNTVATTIKATNTVGQVGTGSAHNFQIMVSGTPTATFDTNLDLILIKGLRLEGDLNNNKRTNTFDINSGSGNIYVNSTKYSISSDLNLSAMSLGCTSTQSMTGTGTCRASNVVTAGGNIDLVTSVNPDLSNNYAVHFDDGNYIANIHKYTVTQRFLDINTTTITALDANITRDLNVKKDVNAGNFYSRDGNFFVVQNKGFCFNTTCTVFITYNGTDLVAQT